eukprot:scaffold22382_cov107-Amphora_coffeaeformis.AAC.1
MLGDVGRCWAMLGDVGRCWGDVGRCWAVFGRCLGGVGRCLVVGGMRGTVEGVLSLGAATLLRLVGRLCAL